MQLRVCLHEGGGPKVGEVTCGGLPHLTCKRDHVKMRDCTDRRVTPPKRVTSPIWDPPPPRKQALKSNIQHRQTTVGQGSIIIMDNYFGTWHYEKYCELNSALLHEEFEIPTLHSKFFEILKFVVLSEVEHISFWVKLSGLIRKLRILEKSYQSPRIFIVQT